MHCKTKILRPEDIEAYQFDINKEGMTEIIPLEKTLIITDFGEVPAERHSGENQKMNIF
ncbi:MAG: hypothetical protein GY795_25105 [Desulfobacterales bacterium]|nr:hypothetical protein [Desulfobacterales bacterium]